jgi:uncharacterized protein (DUF305 family)
MIRRLCWTAVAALLVLTSLTACGTTEAVRAGQAGQNGQPDASAADAPASDASTSDASASGASATDLEALYWARQDSARADFTKADVRFMRMMITHHAQALVMSALAPENGASTQVQTLAARITNAQRDEIATMQRWLRRRDQPVPTIDIDGTALRVDGMSVHGMDMAGILTQAQIDELEAARGTAFDRLFLKYMIEHHRGATAMVDTLFSTDGAAQDEAAFKLASDINADQTTEIARMKRMLDALPPPSAAGPDSSTPNQTP